MNYKIKTITLFYFTILVALTSCTRNAIKNEHKRENQNNDIVKPTRWFKSWECGEKKCGQRFAITRIFSDGNRVDGGVDFQIQSIYDSTMIYVSYIYSSNDDCELVLADTINIDNESDMFIKMNDVRRDLNQYVGEVPSNRMGFDNPINEIIWGEKGDCEMTRVNGKDKVIMNNIMGSYDKVVTKLFKNNDSSSVYEIWNEIKKMANKR